MRRLADARLADEHRIVLAAPAEHLDRALQFVGAADERVEQPLARPLGQVHAVGGQRIGRRRRPAVFAVAPMPGRGRRPPDGSIGTFVMPCEM